MEQPHRHYQSYTLRLSRVASTQLWRATLFCAQDSQRYHFGDLAALYVFLQQATSDPQAEPCLSAAPPDSEPGDPHIFCNEKE